MKWPKKFTLVRHAPSAYNLMKKQMEKDPDFQALVCEYDANFGSPLCVELAKIVWKKFALGVSDFNTRLDVSGFEMARQTGEGLKGVIELPDIIFVSPYLRTRQTLEAMISGWPELGEVPFYEEERIREQEHGLANLYNCWRVFHTLHPEQKSHFDLMGPYWYQYPQGESVPMVRERNRSWISTIIREFPSKNVLAVTHHLNILACRAQLERFDSNEFIRIDNDEKPLNCGVTIYRGDPLVGSKGRLKLDKYNLRLYK